MDFIDISRHKFWITSHTGCYHTDFSQGQKYAYELIEALKKNKFTPFILALIIADFPSKLTAIEEGFLSTICIGLI